MLKRRERKKKTNEQTKRGRKHVKVSFHRVTQSPIISNMMCREANPSYLVIKKSGKKKFCPGKQGEKGRKNNNNGLQSREDKSFTIPLPFIYVLEQEYSHPQPEPKEHSSLLFFFCLRCVKCVRQGKKKMNLHIRIVQL